MGKILGAAGCGDVSRTWWLSQGVLPAGKSTLLELYSQSFKQDPDKVSQFLMIDFRRFWMRRIFESSLIGQIFGSSGDQAIIPCTSLSMVVDEGVLKIGGFLPKLVQILTQLDPAVRRRLHLKLVCRTLES
jgi:hypothetical protein